MRGRAKTDRQFYDEFVAVFGENMAEALLEVVEEEPEKAPEVEEIK